MPQRLQHWPAWWSGQAKHCVMLRSCRSSAWGRSPPSLPATQMEREAAHAPNRDVKMGTLSSDTRRRMHPRVPQTLTASSSNLGSNRHSLPFAPTDVFSVKLQTNICHIVCLINFNSLYAFTATWQMLSLQWQAFHFKKRQRLCYHLSPHPKISRDSHQIQYSTFLTKAIRAFYINTS